MSRRKRAGPSFADLRTNRWEWITAFPKKYYPDHFGEALQLYRPFIERVAELANQVPSSADLLHRIVAEPDPPRVQLLRIFKRYVSPVGLARYDSDRGGAQEDNRIGGNRLKIQEVIQHDNEAGASCKIFFLSDGPVLGLGSM
jgi:hypothetical protein